MTRCVAFLRGMNLGGRRIKNEELRAEFEALGFEDVATSKGKLQVTFLSKKPSAAARREVGALSTDEDRLAVSGRELYWLPSGGISESDLDWKPIDAALGAGTMRTMGTVEQIAARHRSS